MRKAIYFTSVVLLLAATCFGQDVFSGNATALQGYGISGTGPTNGQCLVYVSSTSLWTPGSCGSSGGDTITSPFGTIAIGGTSTATTVDLAAQAFTTQTDNTTVTWAIASAYNANASLTFTVHSGSRTLDITGPVIGGNYQIKLIQDSTGGEGLTLGTGCTWKVVNGGAGAVTLSTGANAQDLLAFTYDGTNCYATLGKNFS